MITKPLQRDPISTAPEAQTQQKRKNKKKYRAKEQPKKDLN